MQMFEVIPLVILMVIPIVAIVGGITAGIIRTLSRQRLVELAQKERIAAIERGLDPDKLPPLEIPPGFLGKRDQMTFEQRQLNRSHGLLIWGIIATAFGVALSVMVGALEPEPGSWAAGMLFIFVGIALMIGSRVGRPDPEDVRRSVERQEKERNGGTK